MSRIVATSVGKSSNTEKVSVAAAVVATKIVAIQYVQHAGVARCQQRMPRLAERTRLHDSANGREHTADQRVADLPLHSLRRGKLPSGVTRGCRSKKPI